MQLVRAKGAEEEADAATVCKLGFADGAALAKRFDPDGGQNAWPLNLTPEGDDDPRDFPFVDESRLIALVHADGNGLGQLLMRLSEATRTNPGRYIEIFRGFSDAVSRATEKAAQRATTEILGPNKKNGVYPARPIVLGGDDLTIVVRADLALPYTREFLASFERTSAKELAGLKRRFDLPDLPDCLTACAGIAYAKASQPFYLLHALAEGLCKHAKKWAKSSPDDRTGKVTSSLSFHRVTTAMVDDFETVLGRELTSGTLRHSLECYAIEGGSRLPALDDLLALQSLLADPKLGRGGTRQLLGIMGRDRNLALRRYTRWREVMEKRFGKELAQFDRLLESLAGVETAADLPFAPEVGGLRRSPLGDFITLRSVSSDAGEKPTDQEAAA